MVALGFAVDFSKHIKDAFIAARKGTRNGRKYFEDSSICYLVRYQTNSQNAYLTMFCDYISCDQGRFYVRKN